MASLPQMIPVTSMKLRQGKSSSWCLSCQAMTFDQPVPDFRQWIGGEPLLEPRHGAAGLEIFGKLYILGGLGTRKEPPALFGQFSGTENCSSPLHLIQRI